MFKGRITDKKATPLSVKECSIDVRHAVVRDRLPYEPLLTVSYPDGSYRILSDVDLIFNQERLDRMTLAALQQRLDESVSAGDVGLSNIRKNVKDEDLQKFIKSRYIQSLTELRQWSHYLVTTYANEVASINSAAQAAAVKAAAAKADAAAASASQSSSQQSSGSGTAS